MILIHVTCQTLGPVPDRGLPAAAADAGSGRAAAVEGARPEKQGDPDGAESLQPFGHRQMPDSRGLVSRLQASRAAERPERGRGERREDSVDGTRERVIDDGGGGDNRNK